MNEKYYIEEPIQPFPNSNIFNHYKTIFFFQKHRLNYLNSF